VEEAAGSDSGMDITGLGRLRDNRDGTVTGVCVEQNWSSAWVLLETVAELEEER